MNFSRPIKADNAESMPESVLDTAQQAPMSPKSPTTLRRSHATYFDRQSITDSISGLTLDATSPPADGPTSTQREPSNEQGMDQAEVCATSNSNLPSPMETDINTHTPFDMTSSMQPPFPQKRAKKARYYSYALSAEDKHALAVGEKNHNLREWTAEDLVRFQESRIDLVHKGLEGREELLEERMKEKKKSELYLMRAKKQVRRFMGLPLIKPTKGPQLPPSVTYHPQASQSMHDVRVSSAPDARLPPTSPELTDASPPLSAPDRLRGRSHARPVSAGDYFAQLPVHSVSQHSQHSQHSQKHSRSSSLIPSPLSNEFRPFKPRADVTFDAFLSPHASGKGEAYRGAGNAKKDEQPGDGGDSIELKPIDKATKKQTRRLSKMPSMPASRLRKGRGKDVDSPTSE